MSKINWTEIHDKAKGMAYEAHQNQYRKDNVTPYIVHPQRVVARLAKLGAHKVWSEGLFNQTLSAAWLHDVLEDTEFTADDLRNADMPAGVISLVETLTHRAGEDYMEYLHRIKQDGTAVQIKLADILDNLADDPGKKQMIKYGHALVFLNS